MKTKDDEDSLLRSVALQNASSILIARQRAEQRQAAYLAEAQRLSHTGSFGWRVSTGEIIWSDETYRIFQYDRTMTPTVESVLQRVHPEDAARVKQTIERASQDGKDFDSEHRLLMPDGSVKHVHVVARAKREAPGGLEFVGAVMDTTDSKRAEEALRRSESYLAEAQRLTHTGSWAFNAITPLYWSEENFRIWGFDPQQGLPNRETILQRIHPEDRGRVVEYVQNAVRERRGYDVEFRIVLPDGAVRYIHGLGHPAFSASGELVEVVGTNVDVTDRKRAEEALRQAQADLAHVSRVTAMGELTASIAHEVNQPLTAVLNNANACLDLLPKTAPNVEEVREALAEIIDDIDRASAVILHVRQLAKRTPVEKSLLDLRDVVKDVLALARYESAARRVTIHADLPENLPSVSGDRVQLQQVLLNLVMNGMDAMNTVEEAKRGLIICGRLETRDGRVVASLRVQDAGPGFKPEEMDRLFEPFYTTKPQGMGMGLAISRSIIEAHGGRLCAEPNQGAGATFSFCLPAVPA